MTTVTSVGAPGVPSPVTIPATRRRIGIRLPRSAKVITGTALLAIFVFLAIFGPALSPYDPNFIATATNGTPQPPSAAHLLGTTNLQQDILSQLLTGTRPIMLVAFLAGAAATVLAVLIGVAAGYFGGLVDDLLSLLINVSLVLPALPLLSVGRAGAPGAGAVAAEPGLRRVGAADRRAGVADHRLRDHAQPDPDHRVVLPVHGDLRHRHLRLDRLPRADQRLALVLGNHPVLGPEQGRGAKR